LILQSFFLKDLIVVMRGSSRVQLKVIPG